MALKGCLKKNNALNPRVQGIVFGSPTWARTRDLRINSPSLYRLSYQGRAAIIGMEFWLSQQSGEIF